ncbi:uncharacterized protein AC631_05212 [Debaryomyces fabryi]|uniref:Peroxisome assembly protein 12 n=1 Tax=Debaryomyces fabryi TaxID=58627 RepID=A0A0V1PS10_9ASCO|nr:uncharacterized protein AC631_05212 [Debaryomyces fabryi]KRZ99024.1 hypothetical protein AC631_05212 [Debaryomyces fabryi]CUM57050.1 unnamed protein product [Debaryomyces fabryi]
MEYYSSLDASQLDSEVPTLFELISASQLESLLSPSLRYILVHYASKYPYALLKVANNFEELNLFFRTFIEWYFMSYWQGSFTENFYGLKRVSQTPLSDTKYRSSKLTQLVPSMIEERRSLSSLQRFASIFEITGVSYLSEKFNYWYEIWYPKYVTNQLVPNDPTNRADVYKTEFKRRFVKLYPILQSIFRTGNFFTTLLYLSGLSKSPTLLTLLFKINYSRLNQYDYSKHEPKVTSKKDMPNKIAPPTLAASILRILNKNITKPSWRLINFILGTFFPIAIFTLKFLEWYNNSNFALKIAKTQGNVLDSLLPPPSSLSRGRRLDSKPKKVYNSGKTCPLCKDEISNPAIIETGYVFCYSCIYNYLTQSHKIVSEKVKLKREELDSDDEESDIEKEVQSEKVGDEAEANATPEDKITVDINKGGRCPITGKKLLGCKWNGLKEEWEIEGIRRLIF